MSVRTIDVGYAKHTAEFHNLAGGAVTFQTRVKHGGGHRYVAISIPVKQLFDITDALEHVRYTPDHGGEDGPQALRAMPWELSPPGEAGPGVPRGRRQGGCA